MIGQSKLKSEMSPRDIVAYFDFDGTITRCDTFLPFLIYATGYLRFILKLPRTLVILFLYGLKIISNEEAKERTLAILVSGMPFVQLDEKARNFALHKLDHYIKPEIYTKLEYHIEHKHQVILVSANLALYLNYWAKRHNIDGVIATEIEFIDARCSGKLKTRNCYGVHKINRVNEYLKQASLRFYYSFGYGNSRGDYELLDYVNEGYWVDGVDIIAWTDYRGSKNEQLTQ